MKFDQRKHHRRSIRLKEHDYSQPGGYFITIVTYQRDLLFGEIVNEEMQLNELGKITDECWQSIPEHFSNVELSTYVIMPNHVPGIVVINENEMATNSSPSVGARHVSPLQQQSSNPRGFKHSSIGAIVASFKSTVTRRIGRKHDLIKIWQRNYYEHVIRDQKDWDRIHRYIESNPPMWAKDEENPSKQHATR